MDSELWGHSIFRPKNGPFAPNVDFLHKSINVISIYLFAPFTGESLKKKMLEWIQCYQDTQFLDAKWPFASKNDFISEKSLGNFVVFIHVYLYAKTQSQMSIY